MKFVIEINTDNDAFEPSPDGEIMRILHDIANRITIVGTPADGISRHIMDRNGNTCGDYTFIPDRPLPERS